MLNNRKIKVKDAFLNSNIGLQPIEVIQLKNLSFDLKTIQEPSRENGYKRKEDIVFFKPTEAELIQSSQLINGLNNGTIDFRSYIS